MGVNFGIPLSRSDAENSIKISVFFPDTKCKHFIIDAERIEVRFEIVRDLLLIYWYRTTQSIFYRIWLMRMGKYPSTQFLFSWKSDQIEIFQEIERLFELQ